MYKNLQGGPDPKIGCKRIASVPFRLPMAHPEAPKGNCRPKTPPILAVAWGRWKCHTAPGEQGEEQDPDFVILVFMITVQKPAFSLWPLDMHFLPFK